MTYAGTLDLLAGGLLLTAVLVVWRRRLTAMITLLGIQGVLLGLILLAEGIHEHGTGEIMAALFVIGLRAVVLPLLLFRTLGPREPDSASPPLVNTTSALLIAGALTVAAYAISRPLLAADSSAGVRAASAALAVVLVGMFVIISRRRAVSQAAGFLMLDNGVAGCAFLITGGVPLIVELGVSLDVFFALTVLRLLTIALHREFDTSDLDQLRELRD